MSTPTQPTEVVTRICPGCRTAVTMKPYDIGSGPEVSCSNCETCFGADGQDLDPRDALRHIGNDPELRKQFGWDNEDGTPALVLGFTPCGECGKLIASRWHWETGTAPVENCSQHTPDLDRIEAP